MNERIGYPNFILDPTELDKTYEGVSNVTYVSRCIYYYLFSY